jgi:hypothetical protein
MVLHPTPKTNEIGNRLPINGLIPDSTKRNKIGNKLPINGLIPDSTKNDHRKQIANQWSYI